MSSFVTRANANGSWGIGRRFARQGPPAFGCLGGEERLPLAPVAENRGSGAHAVDRRLSEAHRPPRTGSYLRNVINLSAARTGSYLRNVINLSMVFSERGG
jgi:hypothetical protein